MLVAPVLNPVLPAPFQTILRQAHAELRLDGKSTGYGYLHRVWVGGRPTDVVVSSSFDGKDGSEWPRMEFRRTAEGQIYGTVTSAFSGAYSGISSDAFVIGRTWTVVRRGYAAAGASGERILLVPDHASPYLSSKPGLLTIKGDTVSIGATTSAAFDREETVRGYFLADTQGHPFSGSLMDDASPGRHRRYFSWRAGIRTLKGFQAADINGEAVGPALVEPPGPTMMRFPIPAERSYETHPFEDPRLARFTKRGKATYMLSVEGRAVPFVFRRASRPATATVARSRKRFVYGTLVNTRKGRRTSAFFEYVAFLRGASGFRVVPGYEARSERDGRVLLRAAPAIDADAVPEAGATLLFDHGRFRPVGPAVEAEIGRDGAVRGWTLVTGDGRPFLGVRGTKPPRLFRQSFVWRDGVRHVTGMVSES